MSNKQNYQNESNYYSVMVCAGKFSVGYNHLLDEKRRIVETTYTNMSNGNTVTIPLAANIKFRKLWQILA